MRYFNLILSAVVGAAGVLASTAPLAQESAGAPRREATTPWPGPQAFEAKVEAVAALLEAHARVAAEKQAGAEAKAVAAAVQALLAQARSLAAAGRTAQAWPLLDKAYRVTSSGVAQLRQGDTLVRELRFDTPAEEYAFEVRRNDTHQRLVQLVSSGTLGGRSNQEVESALERSRALRLQAEGLAGSGDHRTAVKTLEASTASLLKALRAAGIYVPG